MVNQHGQSHSIICSTLENIQESNMNQLLAQSICRREVSKEIIDKTIQQIKAINKCFGHVELMIMLKFIK